MAFNLRALKALFNKLKPAAKSIAPVSDDIAKGVANYGDDALAVANKVDDALPFVGTRPEYRNRYNVDHYFSLDEPKFGPIVSIDGKEFSVPDPRPAHDAYDSWRSHLEYLDDIEMDYGIRPQEMSFEEIAGQRVLNDMTKDRMLEDYLSGFRSYDSPELGVSLTRRDNIMYGMPPPEIQPTFTSKYDYENMLKYLDNSDAVKRVNLNVGTGSLGDVSSQDLLRYANAAHDLKYYDDYDGNDLASVYNELKRRQNTSNKSQDLFGNAPKSFPSDSEFDRALSSLFWEMRDLPY
jgi:hypothetical protein